MRRVLFVALCAAVAGCATTPVPSDSATAQPATSIVDPAATTPRAGAGAILVTRDTGMLGMACTFDVMIDGQRVAGLRKGEQVTLYADPGERILSVQAREGICGGGLTQIAVQVVADTTKKVRVGMDHGWDIKLEPSAY